MSFRFLQIHRMRAVFLLVPLLFTMRMAAQSPGWEISTGVHAYYLPSPGFHIQSLQPLIQVGRLMPFRPSGSLGITFQVGYSRNRYQGDAVYIQSFLGYHPMLGQHLQAGIAIGAGYQRSFFSSSSLRWNGEEWTKGKSSHAVWQVPLQLRLGYRTSGARADWTPFIAYQVHGQFKYSPDLTPLPVSNFLIGVQYAPNKPE
ncbi:MAG: DUF3575 domain-containing protein [Lewinellaceae bacterium]|nr:DUF3575 domain-containing protein [Lewinellaceae bacterium]HPG07860.1 hypothetical protein [Saprospiraceae bacterium]